MYIQYVNNGSNKHANVCYQEVDIDLNQFPLSLRKFVPNVNYASVAHDGYRDLRLVLLGTKFIIYPLVLILPSNGKGLFMCLSKKILIIWRAFLYFICISSSAVKHKNVYIFEMFFQLHWGLILIIERKLGHFFICLKDIQNAFSFSIFLHLPRPLGIKVDFLSSLAD